MQLRVSGRGAGGEKPETGPAYWTPELHALLDTLKGIEQAVLGELIDGGDCSSDYVQGVLTTLWKKACDAGLEHAAGWIRVKAAWWRVTLKERGYG